MKYKKNVKFIRLKVNYIDGKFIEFKMKFEIYNLLIKRKKNNLSLYKFVSDLKNVKYIGK